MQVPAELRCLVTVPKGTPVLPGHVVGAGRDPRPQRTCPADWCYFPDTTAGWGLPLEAIVCTSEPAAPGREIAVKPIALLRLRGQEGYEEIVVCVRAADSAWTGAESIHDIPGRLRSEIEEFATHRPPFVADVAVAGWMSREDAMTAVDDAAARWAATANGRG